MVDTIKKMGDIDQAVRLAAKDSIGLRPPNILIYAVDTCHNYHIRRIIEEHGYPTKETLGSDGLTAWWLLIQHQDFDTSLQEACLKNCGFASKEKAFLVDRVLANKGKKQVYGTQMGVEVKNPKALNKRREEMGLEPL